MAAMAEREAICVGVRLRPFVAYETGQKQCLTIRDNVVKVVGETVGREDKEFAFDFAMDSSDHQSPNFVSQEKCYTLMASRMATHVLHGFNTCLFCYGQTGTGKTTTIMGSLLPVSEQGLLIRLIHDVFEESKKMQKSGCQVRFKVQMLEVYNEKIRDLLHPHTDKSNQVELHVHPKLGVYLKGAVDDPVDSVEACLHLIEYGNTMKTVAATAMNAKSSRAHTIFKLSMELKNTVDNTTITSEAFFVDLAGRENEKTTRVSGDRLVELTFINRSLMWLANCIQYLGQMAEKKKKRGSVVLEQDNGAMMARFRNSKLTLLLSNALSGNSKTAMIGTLSPAVANFEESFSTLNFASTVKTIKVEAQKSRAVDKDAVIKALQEEIRSLKEQLSAGGPSPSGSIVSSLDCAMALLTKHTRNWDDDQGEAKEAAEKRKVTLMKLGVARFQNAVSAAIKVRLKHSNSSILAAKVAQETPVPHLANYSEDSQMCGRLMFHCQEPGKEYSLGFDSSCDFIVPHGLGMFPVTCFLKRDRLLRDGKETNTLWLRVAEKEETKERSGDSGRPYVEVNGNRLERSVQLQHEDCVVIGRSFMCYAITEPGTTVKDLSPERLAQSQHITSLGKDSKAEIVSAILGEQRCAQQDQLRMAMDYVSQLQQFNRDKEGAEELEEFLNKAREAEKSVEEANVITAEIFGNCQDGDGCLIHFELCSVGPILATGYGSFGLPELCVRLVKTLPKATASARVKEALARRDSDHKGLFLLERFRSFHGEVEMADHQLARQQVLFTWTFAKFMGRLELMHDIHETWADDPLNFKMNPLSNPWAEFGPGEVAEMRSNHVEELTASRNECEELRKNVKALLAKAKGPAAAKAAPKSLARGTASSAAKEAAAKQPLSSIARRVRGSEASPVSASSSSPTSPTSTSKGDKATVAEVERLQQALQKAEEENERLRAELEAAKAAGEIAQAIQAEDLSRKGRPGPAVLLSILELSKANVALVLDLFGTLSRLSTAMLQAGSACLQTAPGEDEAVERARSRLAQAADDLATFFASSPPMVNGRLTSGSQQTLPSAPVEPVSIRVSNEGPPTPPQSKLGGSSTPRGQATPTAPWTQTVSHISAGPPTPVPYQWPFYAPPPQPLQPFNMRLPGQPLS